MGGAAAAAGPAEGRLEARPFARLLVDLCAAGASGTLALEGPGRTRARVAWLRGMPVACEVEPPGPGLVALLRERGRIAEIDAARARAACEARGVPEEAALLALRVVPARELVLARRELLVQRLCGLGRLETGAYRFDPQAEAPAGSEALRVDPLPVAQRIVTQEWRPDRLLAELDGRLRAYPRPGPTYQALLARLEPGPPLDALRAGLDGTRTAWELLSTTAERSRIALLWVLEASGALAWSETPVAAAGDAAEGVAGDGAASQEVDGAQGAEPIIEIEVAGDARAVAGAAAAASEGAAAAEDPRAQALREEIDARRRQIGELDHYALLGVARNTSAADLKRAFLKTAKRFHPDAVARLGLDALKREANELFAAITRAHEVLSDPERRREYDAALDGHVQVDADRVAQAETLYRKAELLMRAGQFRQALDLAQGAVALWPEDAAYQGALGWCLFKKTPPDTPRAREHLQRAVELDPQDAVAHLRLAVVLRHAGDDAGAARHTAHARALDPHARA